MNSEDAMNSREGTMNALLRYDLGDDATWVAWVAKVEKVGEDFRLKIAHFRTVGPKVDFDMEKNWQEAGMFKTGVAVVKYVRDLASKKFPDWKPTVDTLDTIKHRTAQSVTPDCYSPVPEGSKAGGRGDDGYGCTTCPYRSGCGDPASVNLGAKLTDQENEGDFLTRLQRKVAKTYGKKS